MVSSKANVCEEQWFWFGGKSTSSNTDEVLIIYQDG